MNVVRAVLLVLLVAAVWPAVGSANSATFTDPLGDAGTAPDVRDVEVTLDDAGNLTFSIGANSVDVWDDAGASLMIDSDANYATGHSDGVDYLLTLHRDHTADFGRWNGSDFPGFGADFSTTLNEGTLAFSFPWRAIGSPARIAFAVVTFDAADAVDQAPEPRWRFSPTITPKVTSLSARFTAARPVHGKRFAVAKVRTVLSNGRNPVAKATCAATLAGKALAGGCAWKIPASGKGKRLVVTVRAAGIARRYAFVVA
jgi:hypothetical protein